MGALTPTLLVDFETRVSTLVESEYSRMASNLWWPTVAKPRKSTSRKETIAWLLSTAMIKDAGKGGNVPFDDLVATYTEIEHKSAAAGLKLEKNQFEDTDGNALDLGGQWATDIGAYMAYWAQKKIVDVLKKGHLTASAGGYTGYDKKALFATDHPVNPLRTGAGTYANLLTGGASGLYPGACPIDDSVTVDVALVNLAKIFAYAATIKMPNGEDPRFLRPKAVVCSPRMFPRAVQLSSAKLIAQGAAGGGAASADVEALIKSLGFATPTMADELAGFESDTTFFVVMEQARSSQLGGVVWSVREEFGIDFYGVQTEAQLSRMNELEWHLKGRNAASPGHPYLILKCKGS